MTAKTDWRQHVAEHLVSVAERAAARDATEYAEYCRLRARGLRPQAFRVLAEFVTRARSWPLDKRAAFTDWLLAETLHEPRIDHTVPQPLRAGLIDQTLAEWATATPSDPRPWRWRRAPEGPRRALELDPTDQIARQRLAERTADALEYATHELPAGYIEDDHVDDDCVAMREAIAAAEGLHDRRLRELLLQRLTRVAALIASYADWRAAGSNETFEEWARAHGRAFG